MARRIITKVGSHNNDIENKRVITSPSNYSNDIGCESPLKINNIFSKE